MGPGSIRRYGAEGIGCASIKLMELNENPIPTSLGINSLDEVRDGSRIVGGIGLEPTTPSL